MARTEADYYELLGVARGASDAEIKQSFRSLARELHPDVSSEPDADRRFREVAEAYEVLSDPERRALYDRYGKAGLQRRGFEPAFTDFGSIADIFASFFGDDFGGAGQRSRPQRGGDVQVVAQIELEEAFTGVTARVPVEIATPCERCDATGAEPGTGSPPVPDVQRGRRRPDRVAEHLRAVRPAAGVSRLRRLGGGARTPVLRLLWRRATPRQA